MCSLEQVCPQPNSRQPTSSPPKTSRSPVGAYDQFRLLGFGEEECWLLVESGADLQLARSLIGAGCRLHLALRIVV